MIKFTIEFETLEELVKVMPSHVPFDGFGLFAAIVTGSVLPAEAIKEPLTDISIFSLSFPALSPSKSSIKTSTPPSI